MNVILFNIDNKERLALYEVFFNKIGFNVLGILSDRDDFDYGTYKKIEIQDLKSLDFDLVLAHNQHIGVLRNILAELGIPPTKSRILYYDFNNVQKIIGSDEIKYLFYDDYEVVDNKLKHTLKYKNLYGRYLDTKSNISDDKKKEIAKEVYSSYKKQISDLKTVPEVYQAGDNWGSFMKATRGDFYNAVKNDDEKTVCNLLSSFFRNCMSTGMFGGEEAYQAFAETKDLYGIYFECFKVWLSKVGAKNPPIDELGMSTEGCPYGINIDGNLVNTNSFLFHSRAVFAKRLLGLDKKSIIAEIGGGTGLLGYYLMKTGANVTYIDFDLPDNLISASYYLKASFPDKKVLIYDSKIPLTKELLLKYDIVLMPNYMIPYLEDKSIDLFVNTISFGEMDYKNICEYYSQIDRCGARYFYHENLFAPQGDYESYPTAVYPELANFKQLYSSASDWTIIFGPISRNHMYVDELYERIN